MKLLTEARGLDDVVKVLVEPGTPHGFNIISQMWSYILWMEKRKRRKSKAAIDDTSKDLMTLKSGAFVVAPCAHDGCCPLDNTGKYCHFVQRLQRTTSQRVYKMSTTSLYTLYCDLLEQSKKSMKLGMIALTRKLQRLHTVSSIEGSEMSGGPVSYSRCYKLPRRAVT
ncbi:hypothetical protein RHGRI_019419 [Rhododendron griersonianum]|uniref:Uncharacterized protein n=1 Tax=Rhododendron griersonianum TaxID=479676 RepID=A0AAV6JDM5_9ERIC|nr:hypothetical protein RHGRI_019419 [Rhododendron griersonianum]